MTLLGLREAYDTQVRHSAQAEGTGVVVESSSRIVRWVAADGGDWSGITWSHLDASNADDEVAAQVAFFLARGQCFEWKLYDYDRPSARAARLLAAGFAAEDEETLMIAEVSAVSTEVRLPDGVGLVAVTDEEGVNLLIDVHERVFGNDQSQLRRSLAAQLGPAATVAMVVAIAGDEPVCSGRVEFHPGRDFASLWGGGTLPVWRQKGIYRALVAYRAQLAAARGYRYLQVDASSQSKPILEHLGFVSIASTTPYIWCPPVEP